MTLMWMRRLVAEPMSREDLHTPGRSTPLRSPQSRMVALEGTGDAQQQGHAEVMILDDERQIVDLVIWGWSSQITE
jgi:hypothetical protein